MMNGVFIVCTEAATSERRHDRKCLKPAVCVGVYRPSCVQVLPWRPQMTQKQPGGLLLVVKECGKLGDVEMQRATSPSVFVCSLTFIVLSAPSHLC